MVAYISISCKFSACIALLFASCTALPAPVLSDPMIATNPLQVRQEAESFTNPVIYADFADNDITKGPDGAWYFSASNMHYSPGAPLLKSLDLVNWDLIGHSLPNLPWDPKYDMTNGTAYIKGSWASTLRFNPITNLWYWIGCIEFGKSYVYTASEPTGPWMPAATIDTCFYDCGLLVEDDGSMYIAYGSGDIRISRLDTATLQPASSWIAYSGGDVYLEGSRLYKRDGRYYILNAAPGAGASYISMADTIDGTWSTQLMEQNLVSPLPGAGPLFQGSFIEVDADHWYFMSFSANYPGGRMPALAPLEWSADGLPHVSKQDGNAWPVDVQYPLPSSPTPPWTGTFTFSGQALDPTWEWNHNPDTMKFAITDDGLRLETCTVTDDLYQARNTLTMRTIGGLPTGIVHLDVSNMADGDRAGIAALRDQSASIAIERSGDNYLIVVRHGMSMTYNDAGWYTTSVGDVVATFPFSGTDIRLKAYLDVRRDGSREAVFARSTDGGEVFAPLGDAFIMNVDWPFFMGYRFGIFNYATNAVGGSVLVKEFTQF